MVKIKKGTKAREVPLASFQNYYKNSGWELCDEVSAKKAVEPNVDVQESNEDSVSDSDWDEAMEDEVEKPLSEMNKAELEALANKLGVSLVGLSTNKQMREAIKAAM